MSHRVLFLSSTLQRTVPRYGYFRPLLARQLNTDSSLSTDYETKYAEKLQKRAEGQGKSLDGLRSELREQEKERRRQAQGTTAPGSASAGTSRTSSTPSASPYVGRKDSSPIKPLDSIFKLDRLLTGSVDAKQISDLWVAYHSSRSGGTGRGLISASIAVDTYRRMVEVASKYPSFVVPVPRPDARADGRTEHKSACEFYYMEWGFHGVPPDLLASANPFAPRSPSTNPQTTTILFTPLQEYKLRQAYATPYLVLTLYTDLAQSHGIVLMRGEITPSSLGAPSGPRAEDDRYMLSQTDAQLLGLSIQKFYLWGGQDNERTGLLRAFHETPNNFKWESLLEHADFPL